LLFLVNFFIKYQSILKISIDEIKQKSDEVLIFITSLLPLWGC